MRSRPLPADDARHPQGRRRKPSSSSRNTSEIAPGPRLPYQDMLSGTPLSQSLSDRTSPLTGTTRSSETHGRRKASSNVAVFPAQAGAGPRDLENTACVPCPLRRRATAEDTFRPDYTDNGEKASRPDIQATASLPHPIDGTKVRGLPAARGHISSHGTWFGMERESSPRSGPHCGG